MIDQSSRSESTNEEVCVREEVIFSKVKGDSYSLKTEGLRRRGKRYNWLREHAQ